MNNLNSYKKKQLTGKKIILKEIKSHNLSKCIEWLSDPEVNRFLSHNIKNITEEQEIEWFNEIHVSQKDLVFTIILKDKNIYIGNCGLHNIDFQKKTCEFGIFIGEKSYWDKGYGTDTINAILNFATMEMGLVSIMLTVYEYNSRAISVYKKCGFCLIKILKGYHFYNNVYWDAFIMEYRKPLKNRY